MCSEMHAVELAWRVREYACVCVSGGFLVYAYIQDLLWLLSQTKIPSLGVCWAFFEGFCYSYIHTFGTVCKDNQLIFPLSLSSFSLFVVLINFLHRMLGRDRGRVHRLVR